MIRRRVYLAAAVSAAVVLSAPFVQQALTAASDLWPDRYVTLGATVVPVAVALLLAITRIRRQRTLRYAALALAVAIGWAYVHTNNLGEAERFHFVEYGLVAWLWYHAARPSTDAPSAQRSGEGRALEDGAVIIIPLLAGVIVGSLDEWFQWFIPIRAGEARDVVLNVVGAGCGLLFGLAEQPPARLTIGIAGSGRARVLAWAAATILIFGLFFYTVHVGHDVADPEIGTFKSRFSESRLRDLARDRAARWRTNPPDVLRRLWREDQYLTEGLWHVQMRNTYWHAGDIGMAWRENRIVEKFFAPVLEVPTYVDPAGHAWPPEQRAAAAKHAGAVPRSADATRAYPYPLYVW